MSFLSRARIMGRSLNRRFGTWDTLAKAMPASKQGDFSATVVAFNKRKEKAASAALDNKIDFDAYKEILGASEVDAIRKEFEAFQYTDFDTEKKAELATLQADLAKTVAAIEEQSASLTAAAASASEELKELQRTRTTLQTSLNDVIRRHPELHAELQERIANEDWDTEAKPVDINALRLQTIEENWDAGALGALDENAQKEFLDEIASLEAGAASGGAGADLPEAVSTYISEWHTLLGRTEDAAALQQFATANTVTDADRAMTNEREIWTEIGMATELCMFERAKGLIAHAEALKVAGDIVVDEAWRASEVKKMTTARHHQDYNTPVAAEELEGKSAEELSGLATAAAARSDFYSASHYMYASRVASGDIDAKDADLNNFSGFANYFHRVSMGMAQ